MAMFKIENVKMVTRAHAHMQIMFALMYRLSKITTIMYEKPKYTAEAINK